MLVPMTKVEVLGHRRLLEQTLVTLQRLALVQIVDASTSVPAGPYESGRQEATRRTALRTLAVQLDVVLSAVGQEPAHRGGSKWASQSVAAVVNNVDEEEQNEEDLLKLGEELAEVVKRVQALRNEIDALEAEQALLPRHLASLRRLLPLARELVELERWDTTALLIERRHRAVVELLRDELVEIAGERFELITDVVDPDMLGALLVFPREVAAKVHDVLGRQRVTRVRLPEGYEGLSLRGAAERMQTRLATLPAEMDRARRSLAAVVGPGERWRVARGRVARALERLEVLPRLGATERVFVLVGWVPTDALATVRETLTAQVGSELAVAELPPAHEDQAPVLMANAAPARPFESLVKLLSVPRAGTLDPTTLMSVFLPLFFGMMLGDVAYGLVVLSAAYLVGRRAGPERKLVRDLSKVLGMGAAWAIVWGFIYGELLGDIGRVYLAMEPLWIDREHAVVPLLLFCIAVGAGHLVLGLLLGLWNAWRVRSKERLLERGMMLLSLSALLLLAAVAAGRLPAGLITPSLAALVVTLAVFLYLHGGMGLISGALEIFSLASNVLSYLRIAAIGLASVYLAKVANALGAEGPLWLGIVVATLLHTLNIALGAFSPTIQALRLHYVEFFGKFFEEGGMEFAPFGGART